MRPETEVAGTQTTHPGGPRPHRCNARVEDLVQSFFAEDGFSKARLAAGSAWRCIMSQPGKEPDEPYQVLKDPQKYLEPMLRPPKPDLVSALKHRD